MVGTIIPDSQAIELLSPIQAANVVETTATEPADEAVSDAVFMDPAALIALANAQRQPIEREDRTAGESGMVKTFDSAPRQHRVQAELPADPLLTPPPAPRHGGYGSGMPARFGIPPNLAGAFSGGSLPGGSSTGGGIGGGGSNGTAGGGGGGAGNLLNFLGVLGDFSPSGGGGHRETDSGPPAGDLPEYGGPPEPTVQFSGGSQLFTYEGAGQATISAYLSGSSTQTITVHYATSDGSATAGIDYTAEQGTLTFLPGQTTASFQVPILDDHAANEPSPSTVGLTLSNPSGATLGNPHTETLAISEDSGTLSWSGGPNFEWGQSGVASPTITTPGNQTNTEGDNVSLQVSASDPNNYPLSYDAVGLPPGLSINSSSGVISGTVAYGAAADFDGSYYPTVMVADTHGGSASTGLSWTINEALIAPTLTNPGNQSNLRGDNVSLQINASDVDDNPLTYQATNLPPGLSIDPDSGLISGTIDPASTLNTPYAVTLTVTDGATGLSANQTFNWTIASTNVAPVLTSPGNQTNAAGDVVSLQLAGSDADGDSLTYTATGLPSGLTLDPISGVISGTLPNSAANGTPYNVTAMASDGMASSSQSFTWAVNYVGVSNPGDQSNLDGDNVSLQLTGNDANNLPLTYSASNLPPGLTINSSTGLISGTISTSANNSTPYAVMVSATDGTHSANQSFNWSVARLALNPPPDQENQEGTAVSLQLGVTDVGGTPSFSATGLPAGLSLNSTTGLISGTLGTSTHGSSPYQVTVTATDGSNNSSQLFVWTVTPRVALVNPGNQGNAAGDAVSLQLSATSPGGTMTYSATGLPSGLIINSGTGLISGTIASGAASSTPYTVTVTANDGTSSSSQTFLWNVSTIYLVPPSDQTNLDDDTVTVPLITNYHGSGTLSYSVSGLPAGLAISSTTGQISGTVANTADTNSPYSVTVSVTDGANTNTQTFNWTINPRVSVDPISDQSNPVGDVVSLPVSGSDAANGTLSYSATGLPSGLSINSSTGVISGAIALGADNSSPYTLTVTVSDGTASVSQSFNWTVSHVALTNPGPQSSADGQPVSLQMQGGDADGDTVTWTASNLPSGLSINSSTGLISGTLASNADQNSPYSVTVTAGDGTHSTSQTFLWTVTEVALTFPNDQTNTEGDNVSLQLQAASISGTLIYSATGLPNGLSLNATTGLISGTVAPGAAFNGPFTVDVAATNGTISASQSFLWSINPVVSLTEPAGQTNNEGDIVSLQVTASDSKNPNLTYSATGLPSGLSINSSTGLISGTVATGDSDDSIYTVTLTASDGTYSSAQMFNWTITHTDTAKLTMSNPGTQVNAAGDSVSLQINASDPDGDTLIYSAANLPDGLSIDPISGIISGTVGYDAVSYGPYAVTVTADDPNGPIINQAFNWIINDVPIAVQTVPVSAVEGQDTGIITVGTFTTTDPWYLVCDFTATVNWGDGTSDPAFIAGGNGSFTVTDNHTYAEKGSYPVSLTITDLISTSASASNTATVADAPLMLNGGFQVGDALHGQPSTMTVGTFSDGNPDATGQDWITTINWGDGSGWSAGELLYGSNGLYTVSGAHSYGQDGTYTVTMKVTDVDGLSATATSTVVVGDLYAGLVTNLNGLSFTDSAASQPASDFTATIAWGDGSPNTVVGVTGTGTFNVAPAQHTYAQDSYDQSGGVYQVTVTINSDDGQKLTGNGTVAVVRPAMTLDPGYVEAPVGSLSLSNVPVAAFAEPDTSDGVSEFGATIDWGDDSTSSGTIQEVSPGLFQVLGSHTYAAAGYYPIMVEVSQGWSSMILSSAAPIAADAEKGSPKIEVVDAQTIETGGGVLKVKIPLDAAITKDKIVNYGKLQLIDKLTGQTVQYGQVGAPTYSKDSAALEGTITLPKGYTYTSARQGKTVKAEIYLLPPASGVDVALVGATYKDGNQTLKLAPTPVKIYINPPDARGELHLFTPLGVTAKVKGKEKVVGYLQLQYGTYMGTRKLYSGIAATFTTADDSTNLQTTASLFGVKGDHFNWYQVITKDGDPLYYKQNGNYIQEAVPYVDPAPKSYYVKDPDPKNPGRSIYSTIPPSYDGLPWYWNESDPILNNDYPEVSSLQQQSKYTVAFKDTPGSSGPNTINYETWLAVVDNQGKFVAWTNVGFSWTWTATRDGVGVVSDVKVLSEKNGQPSNAELPSKLFPNVN